MTEESELYIAKEKIIKAIISNKLGDDEHFPGLKERLIRTTEEAYEKERTKYALLFNQ